MFAGRTIIIATKHGKEKVVAPLLEKELGLKSMVIPDLDTDLLGTFSGEVERGASAMETAKSKCLMVLESSTVDLALASEGSFGMHPNAFFIGANEEILYLIDKKNNLEISAKILSTETNFNGADISSESELLVFAKEAQFPSHALIMKDKKQGFKEVAKGINNLSDLTNSFHYFMSNYGQVYIETDMRAMHNPMRMKVIKSATQLLINKIKKCCPKCQTPGFDISHIQQGLPCENCHFPAKSVLNFEYSCIKCAYTKTEPYPHGKQFENPQFCDFCNP